MNSRECLGRYTNNKTDIDDFINDVIYKARTTSRLTGGKGLNIPITNYTVTYLYEDVNMDFIRGYHAIKIVNGALYLPDVFLENTYNNGEWINYNDKEWKHGEFKLNHTLKKLNNKGQTDNDEYILYKTEVEHYYV